MFVYPIHILPGIVLLRLSIELNSMLGVGRGIIDPNPAIAEGTTGDMTVCGRWPALSNSRQIGHD